MFNQIRSGMKLNLIIQTKSPVSVFFVESAMDLAFEATYKTLFTGEVTASNGNPSNRISWIKIIGLFCSVNRLT